MANEKGFTLLEVLVASMILFMVLASMSLVYKSALIGSEKAEQRISLLERSYYLEHQVRETLRQFANSSDSELDGVARYKEIAYTWQAKRVSSDVIGEALGSGSSQRVSIWHVKIPFRGAEALEFYVITSEK